MRQRSWAAPPSPWKHLRAWAEPACLPISGVYGSQMWPRLREGPEARRPCEGYVLEWRGEGRWGGVWSGQSWPDTELDLHS